MLNLHELYWAAGFLEGEGYFGAPKQRGSKLGDWYSIKLESGQVQKQPLERLQKLFGGKIYLYIQKQRNHKNSFSWQLTGARAASVMMTLWTIMSPKRREQIGEALERWKLNRSQSQAQLVRWNHG